MHLEKDILLATPEQDQVQIEQIIILLRIILEPQEIQ